MLLLELLKKITGTLVGVFLVVILVVERIVIVTVLQIVVVGVIAFISSVPMQVVGEVKLLDPTNGVVLG